MKKDGLLTEHPMADPKLYRSYAREEAISLFGPADQGRSLCDGQWLVLPHHVLGFATVGEPPGASHFRAASRFCWAANRPFEFPDDRPRPASAWSPPPLNFLPQEVRAGRTRDRTIHLFAGKIDEDRFFYLGRLRQSHSWGTGTPGRNFGEGHFELSPPLPSRVWALLGGLRLDGLDHAVLDASLARLNSSLPVRERLAILRQVAEYWHGPIQEEDSLSEDVLGEPLPLPLRWWYRLAGRRRGIVDGFNVLSSPGELIPVEGGRVMFLCENQGGYGWATLPQGEDPPVWGSVDGVETWLEEGMTLSEFLIQSCLFEARNMAVYSASARTDAAGMARLSALMPPLQTASWRWPHNPTRFHAGSGAVLLAEQYGEDAFSVQVGARTENPLGRLACVLYRGWEHLDWSPPPVDPSWRVSGEVSKIAGAIKEQGSFSDLPVLADALSEAGCDDEQVLGHLRESGVHFQGCLVLDSILGDQDGPRLPF